MRYFLILFLIFFGSCARSPLKKIEKSMRKAEETPAFTDSLSKDTFFTTLRKHIDVMRSTTLVKNPMIFGEKKIDKNQYISALEKIFEHENDWTDYISKNFDFYEVYGKDSWGEILATGYYEPKVKGSRTFSTQFNRAIYSRPTDLVSIDYKAFGIKPLSVLGRLHNNIVSPYYSRKEIDEDQKLKGQNLELAFLDPLDAFFIQIQGSGIVELENGEVLHVGYDSQNGYPYVAIGKFLKDVIPEDKMSMRKIRDHLKTLPKNVQQNILNKNPSYVFFKKIDTAALTYTGMEVSPGRTIATDKNFFPKGALAFLDIEEPVFNTIDDIEPTSWIKRPRVVFDQDTGGAITGGGRVDLYFGQGEEAARKAGVMRHLGRLYYLIPR